MDVRVNGIAILGNFKNAPGAMAAGTTVGARRPTITVVGASVLGGAQVVVDTSCPPLRVVDLPPSMPSVPLTCDCLLH